MVCAHRTQALVIDDAGALHGQARAELWRQEGDTADALDQVPWGGFLELVPTLERRAGESFLGTLWLAADEGDVQGTVASVQVTVGAERVRLDGLGRPPF